MRFVVLMMTLLVIPSFAHAGPAAAPAPAAGGVDWNLDATHSRFGFVVKHLAVTNVRGEFKDFSATSVKADAATGKLISVEGVTQAKSVNTGNEKRDEHLRSDDFFNSEKFPTLKLKSKSFTWDGDKFTAEMDITIRDKTKTVKFEGEKSGVSKVNFGDGPQNRVGYSATAKINRKDFNLNWGKVIEAVNVVADEVKIELEIELSRKI